MVSDGRSTPYPLRSRLARHLRLLREESRMTIRAVGRRVGWSDSKMSRIETGLTGITPWDAERLLDVLKVTGSRRDALLALAEAAAAVTGRYRNLEAQATTVRSYELTLVPGIVQTSEYVRALMRSNKPDAEASQAEALVENRLARQALLTKDGGPSFHLVVDETILHRPVGVERVMVGQLRRLLESAELPSVTLQVLPFEVLERPVLNAPFTVFGFGDGLDSGLVALEHFLGVFYLDQSDDVEHYISTFHRLSRQALDPDDTIRLVARLASGR